MNEHIFVLASRPEHPLDHSGLEGWEIVRTVLRVTDELDLHSRPKVLFEHHVRPPRGE